MNKIKTELQEILDEHSDGYQLKTNEEIINMIAWFGCGELEFHTADINRLVVENERAKKLIDLFESDKFDHKLPSDNAGEYNQGYVQAMCNAINRLKEIF